MPWSAWRFTPERWNNRSLFLIYQSRFRIDCQMNPHRFTLDAMSDPVPSLAFADLLAYTDYLAECQAGFPTEPPQDIIASPVMK
jgi:hypothetical protein